ncbi:hypothetical protein, partial [Eubacterium pyruvativorans]|uniref:hypothetical protein n=1 Tax=Eubacterium pyruvativorans TaxID=155865 RepID=UPI0023F01238
PLRCAGGQVVDAGHPLHPKMPKGNLHTNQDLTSRPLLRVRFWRKIDFRTRLVSQIVYDSDMLDKK